MKKRPMFEVVIVTIVVALTLVLAVGLFSGRARVQKGRLLIQELSTMRSSITLYNMINHKYPADLNQLADSSYDVETGSRPYVEFLHRSRQGGFADPFGNQYVYEPRSGWVKSSTPDYTRW